MIQQNNLMLKNVLSNIRPTSPAHKKSLGTVGCQYQIIDCQHINIKIYNIIQKINT